MSDESISLTNSPVGSASIAALDAPHMELVVGVMGVVMSDVGAADTVIVGAADGVTVTGGFTKIGTCRA